ncbi:MAG: hypothetical protein ACR2P4_10575 [Gammaproteobacteria bacterium]
MAAVVCILMVLPGFALQKNVSPLQGYIRNNAESRGVAPCYNISPLQGFYTAPPMAAIVWEIPAFAGMTEFGGNDENRQWWFFCTAADFFWRVWQNGLFLVYNVWHVCGHV